MNHLLFASMGLATGLATGLTANPPHHEQEQPPPMQDLPDIPELIRTELSRLLPQQPPPTRHTWIWVTISALTALLAAGWAISRVPTGPRTPDNPND